MNKTILGLSIFLFSLISGLSLYKFINNGVNSSTIKFAVTNKARTLDPVQAFDDDSLIVIGQTLETLFQYHYLKRPYEVVPLLAEVMPKITEKGTRLTIKIKPNLRYHPHPSLDPKRTVVAKDFINQFKRLIFQPLKSTGDWILVDRVLGVKKFQQTVGDDFELMMKTSIQGIRALDDLTLQIDLIRPDPNFLYFLSLSFTAPIPEELILSQKNDLSKILIGTGPFVLTSLNELMYKFERFKKYHTDFYPSTGDRIANTENLLDSSRELLPFVENIELYIVNKEEKQWEMFFEKQLDFISVPRTYVSQISNQDEEIMGKIRESEIAVKFFPKITTRWLGFNMQDPVIGGGQNGFKIRHAIANAINRDKYIEIISNKTSLMANSIYNPSTPGYSPTERVSFSYNLKRAQELMSSMGYGEAKKLEITYSTRGNQKINLTEAEFLKSQLAAIWIDLKIETLTFSEFLKKGRSGNKMQMWTDNWIYDYPDAENMIQLLISKNYPGINKSGFTHYRVDRLYEKLSAEYDLTKRIEIMQEIEKIVDDQLPWIMMMYETSYTLVHKGVRNYRKSPFIRNFVKYLKK